MKEHPLTFTGAMIQAILDGKKTQTRRIPSCVNSYIDGSRVSSKVFQQHDLNDESVFVDGGPSPAGNAGPYLNAVPRDGWDSRHRVYPIWLPGDQIWVREKWSATVLPGEIRTGNYMTGENIKYHYYATEPDADVSFWKPSIHMPKRASRIQLEVTRVRIERVQDITAGDVLAEGACDKSDTVGTACHKWIALWNSINAKRGYGWEKNLWVWIVEFKRVKP